MLLDIKERQGVAFVDLYRRSGGDLFATDPDRYYAEDGLHPSGEGYRLWFERLVEETTILQALGSAGPAALAEGDQ